MSLYIVVVTYADYEDDSTDDYYGTFRTHDKAAEFAAKVEARLPSSTSLNGNVYVSVRVVQSPLVRPIVKEARRFIAEIDGAEYDDGGFTPGQNSADHAMDFS